LKVAGFMGSSPSRVYPLAHLRYAIDRKMSRTKWVAFPPPVEVEPLQVGTPTPRTDRVYDFAGLPSIGHFEPLVLTLQAQVVGRLNHSLASSCPGVDTAFQVSRFLLR